MELLPLAKLGPRESAAHVVDFGLFLPWVSAQDGNRLWLKLIHEKDQFLQDIPPRQFELSHSLDPVYGDYWSTQITFDPAARPQPRSAWGTSGRYVYRYALQNPNIPEIIDWIIDPFAREYGVGKLSAFTLGYQDYPWSANETAWKTPALADLVFYELMITEFGGDIDKTIALLDYLADLGVNCLEIMPVTNVANVVDWGFQPLGYFGADERFGKRRDLQALIDAAHQRNLAVVLDSVYGHTNANFPYAYVYRRLNYHENPVMGPFGDKNDFGDSTDFNRQFTRDFFYTVNYHWLDCYHVDGFRYDCVPNYYDGPQGQGYAQLVYETYRTVKTKESAGGHWQRFFQDGAVNLVQCAEYLDGPEEILNETFSNCAWQNRTFDAATALAGGQADQLTNLGFKLGLMDYPAAVTVNQDTIPKTALQYLENHDHSRFVCNFRTIWQENNDLLGEGDRSLWHKVQPYLIGLLTAKGIPLLWQGQEFGENYSIPSQGMGRILMFRPVRWDYFYDDIGKRVISLVRKLLKLRRQPQFCRGGHYFYNHYDRYLSNNVLLFSRSYGDHWSLVGLNFGDRDQTVPLAFPAGGRYREELHGADVPAFNLEDVVQDQDRWITIPSNYGRIWTLAAAP